MSLSLRTRADRDDNLAIDIKFAVGALRIARERRVRIDDLRLSKIVGARIERRPNANADQPALFPRIRLLLPPAVPTDKLFGGLEHPGVISGVVNAAVRGGVGKFLGPNVIPQSHFVGRDT